MSFDVYRSETPGLNKTSGLNKSPGLNKTPELNKAPGSINLHSHEHGSAVRYGTVQLKHLCKQLTIVSYRTRTDLVIQQGHMVWHGCAGIPSKEETFKLISLWSDDTIQAQLEGCRRNSEVYRKIAKELTEAGYVRTMEQCRKKIENGIQNNQGQTE